MSGKEIYIEDLLIDQNFIQWVKHPDEDLEMFWSHWMLAHPSRKTDVLLAKEIVLRSEFQRKDPSREAFDEVLQRLVHDKNSIRKLPEARSNTKMLRWHLLRVAVILIFVSVFAGFIIYFKTNSSAVVQEVPSKSWITRHNQAGLKSQIRLPDGTKVWLNSESTLEYPSQFDSLSRSVILFGEAYFEVEKDINRPFTVQSGKVSTTALGTSFNICAYPEEQKTSISLVSGKILVSQTASEAFDQLILTPGEQAVYTPDKTSIEKVQFNFNSTIGWKDDVLVFDEADISTIVSRLERWYGVDFKLLGSPDENWRINGTFKKQSLERVLDRLAFAKGFTFEIDGKNVILKFNQPKNIN